MRVETRAVVVINRKVSRIAVDKRDCVSPYGHFLFVPCIAGKWRNVGRSLEAPTCSVVIATCKVNCLTSVAGSHVSPRNVHVTAAGCDSRIGAESLASYGNFLSLE